MKKTQILMISKDFEINGISTVIMNYCKNIDLSKFNITIIAGQPINEFYKYECKNLGIKIIELPNKKIKKLRYYTELFRKIHRNYYDVIHVHGNSSILVIEMFIAFLKNIKVRIAHCHNTQCTNLFVHKLFLPIFNLFCTDGFACSDSAGKWLFGKNNYTVIPNGFEIEKFKYSEEQRKKIRKKLNIKNQDFLIGHIGRFNNQKNQEFLITIMKEICSKRKDIYLLLIGDGPNFEKFKQTLEKDNIKNNVILYKETNNPEYMYSAMDLFLFPSKYEGLGIVMLEAQINGLNCIASNRVPNDAKITKNVEFLSIDGDSHIQWSEKIIKYLNKNQERKKININTVSIQQYNIKKNVKVLEKKYINLVNKK